MNNKAYITVDLSSISNPYNFPLKELVDLCIQYDDHYKAKRIIYYVENNLKGSLNERSIQQLYKLYACTLVKYINTPAGDELFDKISAIYKITNPILNKYYDNIWKNTHIVNYGSIDKI